MTDCRSPRSLSKGAFAAFVIGVGICSLLRKERSAVYPPFRWKTAFARVRSRGATQ